MDSSYNLYGIFCLEDTMPSFKCKDIGMACTFEASASTEQELMKKISEHAASVHNIKQVPPDLMEKIKQAIKK